MIHQIFRGIIIISVILVLIVLLILFGHLLVYIGMFITPTYDNGVEEIAYFLFGVLGLIILAVVFFIIASIFQD